MKTEPHSITPEWTRPFESQPPVREERQSGDDRDKNIFLDFERLMNDWYISQRGIRRTKNDLSRISGEKNDTMEMKKVMFLLEHEKRAYENRLSALREQLLTGATPYLTALHKRVDSLQKEAHTIESAPHPKTSDLARLRQITDALESCEFKMRDANEMITIITNETSFDRSLITDTEIEGIDKALNDALLPHDPEVDDAFGRIQAN